ncbi:hypothetical protein JQ604_38605 [Bradyrhizobium jicamae]|uniref:hypothetical protein n=1 Tax=Bradyrhizobium jicamae TaxID=280332 RepID=UPI001BADB33C|nr:hypothetical protein [Bradyrhizobium jicamae]MBR0758127.1 hypothetical protein [Bradyrhizobium jicamae]
MVGFPLLLVPLAIYNILVFLMPTVSLTDPLIKITLVSGVAWAVTLSDVLLALGILMLMLEVIKGARPGAKYLTDHLLALIVFGAAAAEFVMWPQFGTSTYCLLTLLAMADFFGGIAQHVRRRALVAASVPAPAAKRGRKAAPDVVEEPQVEPAPAPAPAPTPAPVQAEPAPAAAPVTPPTPSVPSAASVAESVLQDHPQPKAPQPASQDNAPR